MLFCVLHHAFSIGVSTAFASITRRFKVWKKWRRGTRISSSFPCPFPPSAETCGDITLLSCNQMTIPLENYANGTLKLEDTVKQNWEELAEAFVNQYSYNTQLEMTIQGLEVTH